MATRAKLLIVDTEAVRADELARALAAYGFPVTTLRATASDLVERLREHDFDVLLCDAALPVALPSGLLRSLRDSETPVTSIILSEDTTGDNVMSALRSGASDFFGRPVGDLDTLVAAIDRAARQRWMRRELADSRRRLEAANRELKQVVRALEQDQQAGRQVQLRMLPRSPLQVGDYELRHTIVPSLYLSGDFTDYFTVGEHHIVLFIADVSGHGSSSAFVTVLLKNLFARKRSDFLRQDDPSVLDPLAMLALANAELLATGTGKFATLCVAVLDIEANTLVYSVAGHLPLPLLASADGVHYLGGEGSPVGMMQEPRFTVATVSLPDRFVLALFTDGILEVLPVAGLIEKEQYLQRVFTADCRDPSTFFARLALDTVAVPDDIAALFVAKRGP